MARMQINNVRCGATTEPGSEKMTIQMIADIPPQLAFGTSQFYGNGTIQPIGQTLEFNQQLLIALVVHLPAGDIPFIPFMHVADEVPGQTIIKPFFPQQGGSGAYFLSFQMLPSAGPTTPSPTSTPPGGGPSTSQLNKIGQAITEALATTFTVIPIGDQGSITVDIMQFDPNKISIDFHVTIHYKQSGAPGFLGQITGPLYEFTTFYQGSISQKAVLRILSMAFRRQTFPELASKQ
jgi:hypothetical protein